MERSTAHGGHRSLAKVLFRWCPALLFAASFLGCGGVVGSAPPQPAPSGVTVSLTPASASMLLGTAQAFTVVVANSTNTAVNWSVNGISGGNATVGTITTSGVYTSPGDLPATGSVSVQATSAADSSKSASAVVTVTSDISVSVSPLTMPMELGAARPFAATVASAGNPNRAVNWIVSGSGCAGAACGAVDPAGTYTAPQILTAPPSVSVRAVSVSPPAATMALGSTLAFHALVTGAQDATVTWDVSGIVGGDSTVGTIVNSQTDPDNTTYTAPLGSPAGGSVTVRARSNANPAVSASATVTFTAAINVTLTPTSATLAVGHRRTFAVQVNNTADQNVTWQVNGSSGGNL